jgi:hypothetical protein
MAIAASSWRTTITSVVNIATGAGLITFARDQAAHDLEHSQRRT